MAQVNSEWLKTFKNDRNELNQYKLAPDGQNQSRIDKIEQNAGKKGKISLNWLLWSKMGKNVRNELNRSKMAPIGPN